MSDRTLQAVISAVDKASPIFKTVADGATRMGTSIQQSAAKTNQALKNNTQAVNDLKIGTAALGAAFTLASRAAQDQARQQDAIARLYGESADEINQLSEAIQDNTRFSNDQARQAAITGSSLAQNYELSAEQIGVLIERSADLAQIHGIDLTDAMSRVAGAIRGEGEAAELLGLNMSDAAVASAAAAAGLEGWNTTMTEAEKAAFRYQMVLEQTTATQGAAADAADSTAGKVAQLSNQVQDAAQSFAAWTGPLGQTVAALSDHAVEIAVVGTAAAKLIPIMAGLATALGPVGLALAIGATAAAVITLADAHDAEAEGAANAAAATERLVGTITDLTAAGDPYAVIASTQQAALAAIIGELPAEIERLQKMRDELLAPYGGKAIGLPPEVQAQFENLMYIISALQQLQLDSSSIWLDFNAIISDTGTGADLAQAALSRAFEEFARTDDLVAFLGALQEIAAGLSDFDAQANKAAASTGNLTDAFSKFIFTGTEWVRLLDLARQTTDENAFSLGNYAKQASAGSDAITDTTKAYYDQIYVTQQLSAANDQNAFSLNNLFRASLETGKALTAEAEANQEVAAAAMATGDALAGVGSDADGMTAKLDAANDSLRANKTALDQVADGTSKVSYQLAAFKEVQDGLISQQDVYNQQFSEYGSQLSAIERAQEILNDRRAKGIELTDDELAFLEEAPAAQERLTAGQEDAAIAAGELAVQYGENMSTGDKLNETLAGMDQTTGALTEAINQLILALNGVPADVTSEVNVNGADDALAAVAALNSTLDVLDGKTATTYVRNVIETVNRTTGENPFIGGPGGGQRDGGIIEARTGVVTRGMRGVLVGENGPEMVVLPGGARVRNAAATSATVTGGVIVNMHIGTVSGMGEFAEAIDQMTRMIRQRYAGLGM